MRDFEQVNRARQTNILSKLRLPALNGTGYLQGGSITAGRDTTNRTNPASAKKRKLNRSNGHSVENLSITIKKKRSL